MPVAIDATGIQFRRLNLSSGPAVWSTRAQADRIEYNDFVVKACEETSNLEIIEATASELLVENDKIVGVGCEDGQKIMARAVVIATGTFLGGLIHIGDKKIEGGRLGEDGASALSKSFRSLGFEVGRLKTGTPPRLDGKSVDLSKCEPQPGEDPIPFFSYRTKGRTLTQISCHLTKTTAETKRIITENMHRSPIFSGQIDSTGPRYCPSIEDKFFRFKDKESHQLFLEPEGNGTDDIYPNGFSTALPEDVQLEAIRTVIGLEEAIITKPGYAVEYDYCPSFQIKPSLETKRIAGLFFAGQINGTSGYEEAAAQGLMAGLNASLMVAGEKPLILDRSEAYIGVMIDDLVTRSTTEPYRMFTSRAEYRLALREDNARERLFAIGHRYNLIPDEDYREFAESLKRRELLIKKFESTHLKVSELGELSSRFQRRDAVSMAHLFKLPGVDINDLIALIKKHDSELSLEPEALSQVAIKIRYEGYIAKQQREIDKFKKQESVLIPDGISWSGIVGLKNEAVEKFSHFKPQSLGQASRIEGITPGDISVLSVHLKRLRIERAAQK